MHTHKTQIYATIGARTEIRHFLLKNPERFEFTEDKKTFTSTFFVKGSARDINILRLAVMEYNKNDEENSEQNEIENEKVKENKKSVGWFGKTLKKIFGG